MKSNSESFCGLDLQKNYFSLVQYSSEEHAVTLISIQPFSAGNAVRDEWKVREIELKNIKGRLSFFNPSVNCGLPAEYAIVKKCPLDADETNIQELLEWELSQHIIGSVDNYIFDSQEIEGRASDGVRNFLVAAYRREIVNRVTGMVRSIKLTPRIIDLDIFALINIFEANYPEKNASPCLIVHSEPEQTKLVVTQRGNFLDYHCFEHKTGPASAAGFAPVLAAEINRFRADAADLGGDIGIFVSGSYFQQTSNKQEFFEKMPGAETLNPFRKIKCQVKIEAQQLQEYSAQLAVAVGLALRGDGRKYDASAVKKTETAADHS